MFLKMSKELLVFAVTGAFDVVCWMLKLLSFKAEVLVFAIFHYTLDSADPMCCLTPFFSALDSIVEASLS